MRRVVVTGMGIISSIGTGVDEVRSSLKDAKSGITFSDSFAEHGFRSQVWGEPKLVDPTEHVDRRAMRFLSRAGAWSHLAMKEALADSGLEDSDITNERTGIVVGSGGADTNQILTAANIVKEKGSPKRIGPFAVPKAMSSTASATLATWFKIHGVNYSISSACSTSAHCIGNATELIQWGKQDVVIAGGHEDLHWSMSCLFDAMGAMSSKHNDDASSASRAYDATRDGFVIAGGAGIVVLEELEHAKARGAKIYGEIVGYGATSDGFDMVAPSGEGAVRSMKMALSTVDSDVDYVNTHGTSTGVGDIKEIGAIKEVFGEKMPHIQSTKSLTGHSLGATGVQEAIYTLLMMNGNFIGESAHITEIDPEFADVPIVRKRIDDAKFDTAISNSFGFGGTNATLAMRRYNG